MMDRRTLIGSVMLAVTAATVASAAVAQDRGERMQRMRDYIEQKRALKGDPAETRITRPGTTRYSFQHGGLTREYIVHVPANLPRGPAPLLLALHGGGGDMDQQAKNYGLKEKAAQAGFIVVFPSGSSRMPGGILATWNAGTCCGGAVKQGVDDVGFLQEVVARVGRQTNVDRTRVFSTGMSNGGLMSYRLACDAPGLLRGIAPVAGTDNTARCTPSRPTAVIHFHARDDDHVPFEGGKGPKTRADTSFTSVPATIAKWVGIDRAVPQPRRVLSVPGAACDLHAAGPGGAPVELCVTDTGGHSWPGIATARSGKNPSMAISANDLMWDFFKAL